jgi:hypothetical protein
MPDLDEQIREFIDSGATPVTAQEVVEAHRLSRSPARGSGRYRRPSRTNTYAVGAVAMAVAICVLIVVVVLGFGSSPASKPKSVTPAHPASVPASWQKVTFGGLTMDAPGNWPVRSGTAWNPCDLGWFYPNGIVLNTGASVAPPIGCPALLPPAHLSGLFIDPGPNGPLEEANYAQCSHTGGLAVCPTIPQPAGGALLNLLVHIPGRAQPVEVEIGLAGGGNVAQTILGSMRAIMPKPTVPPTTSTTANPAQTHGVPTCSVSQLAATATRESGAASHMGIVVAFKNTAATQCSLAGYPTSWFANAAGHRLGDVSTDQGGNGHLVVLLPGGFASTTVWTANPGMVAGGSVGASCHPEAASGIDIKPPGQSAVVLAPIEVSVCTTYPADVTTTAVAAGTQESEGS